MRKLTIKAILYFGFFLSWVEFNYRRIRKKCAKHEDVRTFINDFKLTSDSSAERIAEVLRSAFTYRKDKSYGFLELDYAKHPLVFLYDRRDDCDGFAAFAEVLLNELGFENVSRVYTMTKTNSGHAVCVAKVGKFHYAFGNWPSIVLSSNELMDIGKIISRGMSSELDFAVRARYNSIVEFYSE